MKAGMEPVQGRDAVCGRAQHRLDAGRGGVDRGLAGGLMGEIRQHAAFLASSGVKTRKTGSPGANIQTNRADIGAKSANAGAKKCESR